MKKTTKKSKILDDFIKILIAIAIFVIGLSTLILALNFNAHLQWHKEITQQTNEATCANGQVKWEGNSGYSCTDGFWIFDRSRHIRWGKTIKDLEIQSCAARFYVGAPNTTYESVYEKCKNEELK